MTQVSARPVRAEPATPPKGTRLLHMLSTTDPKDIALLYLVTSFGL